MPTATLARKDPVQNQVHLRPEAPPLAPSPSAQLANCRPTVILAWSTESWFLRPVLVTKLSLTWIWLPKCYSEAGHILTSPWALPHHICSPGFVLTFGCHEPPVRSWAEMSAPPPPPLPWTTSSSLKFDDYYSDISYRAEDSCWRWDWSEPGPCCAW